MHVYALCLFMLCEDDWKVHSSADNTLLRLLCCNHCIKFKQTHVELMTLFYSSVTL